MATKKGSRRRIAGQLKRPRAVASAAATKPNALTCRHSARAHARSAEDLCRRPAGTRRRADRRACFGTGLRRQSGRTCRQSGWRQLFHRPCRPAALDRNAVCFSATFFSVARFAQGQASWATRAARGRRAPQHLREAPQSIQPSSADEAAGQVAAERAEAEAQPRHHVDRSWQGHEIA